MSDMNEVKIGDEIKFDYDCKTNGIDTQKECIGIVEKVSKKTINVGGHIYRKEKMNNIMIQGQRGKIISKEQREKIVNYASEIGCPIEIINAVDIYLLKLINN